MLDYFEDCYNIEYRVASHTEYRSVQVMVACGGPNIYVDTKTAAGELVKLWEGWSMTTGRHIAAFCGLNKAEYSAL